jgi:hypothetical protein
MHSNEGTIAKLNSKGAAAMSEYLMEMIGYQVQGTGEWRRAKAEQFPDDQRNLTAAEQLDELAEQIEQVASSEQIHEQIAELQGSIASADIWVDVGEAVSAELRAVGFHSGYTTALEFLEWYRDLLQEKLLEQIDEVVPAVNLDEQIANAPAVKAAKRAYDEAYAKAYAEARKKL